MIGISSNYPLRNSFYFINWDIMSNQIIYCHIIQIKYVTLQSYFITTFLND